MAQTSMRRVGRVTIGALTVTCSVSCGNGRGNSQHIRFERVENATYVGCVAVDYRDPHRLLLWTLDAPGRVDVGAGFTHTGQSTTVNGPWLGTRQLELVGDQVESIGRHRDGRVRVSGVLEEQEGTTGFVDQVQNAQGAVFRQLRPTTFETVEGTCAFDARR
jgi:hypothetical protein